MSLNKFLVIALLGTTPLRAEYFKMATISSLDSPNSELLFTIEIDEKPEENFVAATYKDSYGQVVISEESLQKNVEMIQFQVINYQENYRAKVYTDKNLLHFELEKNQVTKHNIEKYTENCVSVATLIPYIHSQWPALTQGQKVEIRLIIPDRLETIRFQVSIDDHDALLDQYIVKMKPSSFLVSLVLEPLFLKLNRDATRILGMKGRVLPMILVDGEYKNLDANVRYYYK